MTDTFRGTQSGGTAPAVVLANILLVLAAVVGIVIVLTGDLTVRSKS